MRNNQPLLLLLLAFFLLFGLIFGGQGHNRPVLMADDGEAAVFLPAIFARLSEETPTPTATLEVSLTPSMTETVSPTETMVPTLTSSPSPSITPSATFTPTMASTSTPTMVPSLTVTPPSGFSHSFLPILLDVQPDILPVPVPVAKNPPVDFDAERRAAWAQGYDLAFNKIGFHIQLFGGREGLDDYIQTMDDAGVPVVLKAANDAEYLFKTQELGKRSGVKHVLIYRDATNNRDIPNYNLDPVTAARLNWQENRRVFPPELDPSIVWMETINEPDRTKAAWLAAFSLEQAKLAVNEGVRYAAFSWAGGEPEPEHWESPEMLAFLSFAAQHQDQVAIAVHEYSFDAGNIGLWYPDLIGRFQTLFDIADRNRITRPTVLVTEWGWEYNHAPDPQKALDDIKWASWLYAAYPQIKGAAIWTLGKGGGEFGDIDEEVLQYLGPLAQYSISSYFLYSPGTRPIDADALAPDAPTRPTPTATPRPTVTPDPDNPLRNGSFEDGWQTIDFGNQRPNFWEISWVEPGEALYDSPDKATGVCECVHKLESQLPPEERPGGSDPLILSGTVTYKIFSASQAFGTQLSQTAAGLTPGEQYRLSVPLRMHTYGETDPYGAEASVWVDGLGNWSNVEDMGDRRWCKHEIVFTAPSDGAVEIDIRVKSKYPSTKDFFMDDFRLVPAGDPLPHPAIPLCKETPTLQRYQPYHEPGWVEQFIGSLETWISDISP